MANIINMENEAKIADGRSTDSCVTFGRDSELLVMAVGMGVPTGDWDPDDESSPEHMFITSGMEQIVALAFGDDAWVRGQEACESDYGIWFCTFRHRKFAPEKTGREAEPLFRIVASHFDGKVPTMYVQCVFEEQGVYTSCSRDHRFNTPAELAGAIDDAEREMWEAHNAGELFPPISRKAEPLPEDSAE